MQRTCFIRKAPAAIVLALLLTGCASYHQKIQKYYLQLETGSYESAYKTLEHLKLMKKPRNAFLYNAEKGRVSHLMGMYDSSNSFLNAADLIADIRYKGAGQAITGTLLNPMMQTYRGANFERLMLHYYKALNYSILGQQESALVEARRISLVNDEQFEDKKEKDNKYSRDAFSFNLQGILYEQSGDINNAFIAYRNAAETYLSQTNQAWFGVPIPRQLQSDVIRTAALNGFTSEQQRFERIFNSRYTPATKSDGGELILFIENGQAPVKEEENLFFALVKGVGGSFYFTDPTGGFNIPFDFGNYNTSENALTNLRSFRIALPKYTVTTHHFPTVHILADQKKYQPELVQDINNIAVATMRENRLKDITSAVTRLAVKKLAEMGAREAGKAVAKKPDAQDSKEEKAKKDDQAEAVGAAVGLLFQAFSLASEKADTRNWQSLPAFIQYIRIPLKPGVNNIIIQTGNNKTKTKEMMVNGTGGLQMRNILVQ